MSPSRRRAAIGIAVFSVLHFITAAVAFCITFDAGMDRFDFGGEPTLVEELAQSVAKILFFPGYQFAQSANIHNNAAEWLVVFGNSFLWGLALYGMFTVVGRPIRFSRGTMIIALTLVAVVLGLAVRAVRQ